jgi:arylsulfatase A-like enzyme
VIHSWANADGTQKIEDTGPLTKKRMETVDDETSDRALEFIREQQQAGNPWFVWWNGTRMHFRTHVKKRRTGESPGRMNMPTAWSSTICTSANF